MKKTWLGPIQKTVIVALLQLFISLNAYAIDCRKLVPVTVFDLFQRPIREVGDFSYSEAQVLSYYQTQPGTQTWLELKGEPQTTLYKVNELGDFQAQNWQGRYAQLFENQQRWQVNVESFIEYQNVQDFLTAKIRVFEEMKIDDKTHAWDRPYHFMKEWGGLNHPPLANLLPNQTETINKRFTKDGPTSSTLRKSVYQTAEFQKQLDIVSQSELTSGNMTQPVPDKKSYEAKLQIIREAKKSIFVSSLVFVDDTVTAKLVSELIRRKNEGLDVRIILDQALSVVHPQIGKRLKAAGIPVVYADEFLKYNTKVVYHTKVVIADGLKAVMGGQNMLDADLNSEGTNFKNRDLDMYLEGPSVTDMFLNFMNDWNHFAGSRNFLSPNKDLIPFSDQDFKNIEIEKDRQKSLGLRGSEHYEEWFKDPTNPVQGIGRFIGQQPGGNASGITEAHMKFLDGLQKYFVLTNPHNFDTHADNNKKAFGLIRNVFTNFNRLFDKIQDLLNNKPGFQMDYITTGFEFSVNEVKPMTEERMARLVESGNYLASNLNQLWLEDTNRRLSHLPYRLLFQDWVPHDNNRVWLHHSYLHSKVWLFDRIAVSVGSFNLHHNATDHSYEATFISQDPGFVRAVEEVLALDMANSIPLLPKD